MCDRDREFLRYYNKHRIDDQKGFYQRKSGWNEGRANAFIVAAGVVMFLSSVSSWAATQAWGGAAAPWYVVATITPALSGAIVAVRGLYEYERNHT